MDGSRTYWQARPGRRLLILTSLFVLVSASVGTAGEVFPRDRVIIPFMPTAAVSGPGSIRYNPAGLSVDQGLAINYYHTYSDSSSNGDDALILGYKGLGFATEWLGSGMTPNGRSYTIALSTGNDRFFAGSAYQWRTSDDPVQDKSHFWSHGVMYRPNPRTSFGVSVDNYNKMKINGVRSDAVWAYSLAFNLLDNHLVVGGDWYQRTSQNLQQGMYRVAAAYEVSDGLTLYGDLDQQENYFLGARVNLTNAFFGSHAMFLNNGGYNGGVAYAGLTQDRSAPVIRDPREVVELRLEGEMPDRKPPHSLLAPTLMTEFDWLSLLDKVAHDPMVDGVILTINQPQVGLGRAEELRRAITRVRQAGKTVVAYCDGAVSNKEYFIASAADRVVIPPVSTVDLLGLRAEVTFYKRLLAKIGVKADLEHIGNYKSASELVTRTDMSDYFRESLNALLDDMDDVWIAGIADGRGVSHERVRQWVEHGSFVSDDARAAGVVDNVAYSDELPAIMRATLGGRYLTVSQKKFRHRSYVRRDWGERPHVAVVFADGFIAEGMDSESGFVGKVLGSRTISQCIRRAREDGSVRAIVLRVNSGGGSVFAADEIWREVSRTIGVKPIIVSFGDMAASGGYYISCGADSIFALPGTITGSIGVISGKIVLDSLYQKVGMDKEVLTRGRYADLYGMSHTFDDDERNVIREQIERAYGHFVDLVADGRHLTTDSVDVIAQGRTWSGVRGKQIGLVDRYADLWEVVQVAARMGGVSSGQPVDIAVLPNPGWELFQFDMFGGLAWMMGRGSPVEGVASLLRFAGVVNSGPAYTAPYTVTVQ